MMNTNYVFTCECGCEVELDMEYLNSEEEMMKEHHLCEDCFRDLFGYCEMCQEYERVEKLEEMYDVREGEWVTVCKSCSSDIESFYCEYHDRIEFDEWDGFRYIENYGNICETAWEYGDFDWCANCECYFHCDDMIWDEAEEVMYCECCFEEICGNRIIQGYHANSGDYEYCKLATKEEKEEGGKRCYYGMEIEIENMSSYWDSSAKEEVAGKLNEATNNFVFERDGSLDDGFEIISNPFTKAYMNEKLDKEISKMFEIIQHNNFGVKDTCGLHFHISRMTELQECNLICVIEYYKEEILLLSKREARKLNRWSKFITRDMSKEELTKTKIMDSREKTKYCAVNICPRNTIELRFFNGTMCYSELMARFEMISNINEWCMHNVLNEDLSNIPSLYELLTYDTDKYVTRYLLGEFPELVSDVFTNSMVETTN